MVATPTYTGSLDHQYLACYIPMLIHSLKNRVQVDFRVEAGFSLIQYARNFLVYQFLKNEDYTHMLWIDADLGFDPTALVRMLNRKVDVIGGVYTNKNPTTPKYPYIAAGSVVDGMQEAYHIPGGFMLVSREAVKAVADKCPTHFMEHGGVEYEVANCFDLLLDTDTKRFKGEDFVYCDRLRAAGYKIYIETDISFLHVGRREWPGNLSRTLIEEEKKGVVGQGHKDAWANP